MGDSQANNILVLGNAHFLTPNNQARKIGLENGQLLGHQYPSPRRWTLPSPLGVTLGDGLGNAHFLGMFS